LRNHPASSQILAHFSATGAAGPMPTQGALMPRLLVRLTTIWPCAFTGMKLIARKQTQKKKHRRMPPSLH
jgi:hypothetical protein